MSPEIESLWGEEFTLKEEDIKKILNKAKNKKSSPTSIKNQLRSKNVSIDEKIELIKKDVDRILGNYKENTIVIDTVEDLHNYISKSIENGVIAIDTETCDDNGIGTLDTIDCHLVGLCLYTPGEKQAYVPVNHCHYEVVENNLILKNKLENQISEADIKVELQRVLDNDIKEIYHNAPFDIGVLMSTCDIRMKCYWDCSIGAKVLNELEQKALKFQYSLHVDPTQDKYDIEHLFQKMPYVIFSPELFALYAATDSYKTYWLYDYQKKQLDLPENEDLKPLFFNVEMPCIDAIVDMQQNGVCVDKEYAYKISKQYHEKLDSIEAEISEELNRLQPLVDDWKLTPEANSVKRVYPAKKTKIKEEDIPVKFPLVDEKGKHYKLSGKSPAQQLSNPIQISSGTQLQILLYDIMKVPVVDKSEPRGTKAEILEELARKYKLCDLILQKREVQILLDTFIDKIPTLIKKRTGRVHAKFNQYGADTGRLSSGEKDPNNPKQKSLNLQNIPAHDKTIRMIFKASPGYSIVGSDYSAQEPRSTASLANDKDMLRAYDEGKDLYAVIGAICFHCNYDDCLEFNPITHELQPEGKKRRSRAKAILLGITYGMSYHSLAERIDVSDEEAKRIIEDFYKGFKGVDKLTKESQKMLVEKGYVTDMWGRRRHLPDAQLPDFTVTPLGETNTFNPLIGSVPHEDKTLLGKIKQYEIKLSKARSKAEIDGITLAAKRDGFKVRNNKLFKARAMRQCLNARIQGTAASMTKRAMALIHSDPELNRLGFKLLVSVHDEVFGTVPTENSEAAGKRLSEVMVNAAKEKCVCKFKCDPYNVKRWYLDECSAEVMKDFNNLINKGTPETEALDIIKNNYSMISPKYVEQMCYDKFDCVNTEDI